MVVGGSRVVALRRRHGVEPTRGLGHRVVHGQQTRDRSSRLEVDLKPSHRILLLLLFHRLFRRRLSSPDSTHTSPNLLHHRAQPSTIPDRSSSNRTGPGLYHLPPTHRGRHHRRQGRATFTSKHPRADSRGGGQHRRSTAAGGDTMQDGTSARGAGEEEDRGGGDGRRKRQPDQRWVNHMCEFVERRRKAGEYHLMNSGIYISVTSHGDMAKTKTCEISSLATGKQAINQRPQRTQRTGFRSRRLTMSFPFLPLSPSQ